MDMGNAIPPNHPLRQLFGTLTEKSFSEHLGWPDLKVSDYISNLLVEFTHTDQLYKIQDKHGKTIDTVAGLLPEYLRRLKSASMIYHKDFLVDYVKTGKRSYGIVATCRASDADLESPLFRKLSENFELCVTALGFVRNDLDRMQDPSYRKVKKLLLN